jgi:hypothetical protein
MWACSLSLQVTVLLLVGVVACVILLCDYGVVVFVGAKWLVCV